ncbi:hypothetical protein E1286_31940 [Nonomuraea terrae]|uniref:Berberine/berberine-like domain-containing protein n=1 Tax=Nonomuraea terrae TaxID=2530383 RepID=A0A4R4YBK2_9ACTN|nr:hypothetical protein [Nonomuraea terrae]TDD41853.1 hypothetical protein E1286_31940 [Nonomuraea terrae]
MSATFGEPTVRPQGGAHLWEASWITSLPDPAPGSAAVRERLRQIAGTLVPHTSGRKPFTFLAAGEHAASAFTPDTLARLRALKRARDPRGTFRSNFPVLAVSGGGRGGRSGRS